MDQEEIFGQFPEIDEREKARLHERLTVISTRYPQDPGFFSQLRNFYQHRLTLINTLKSSANELEKKCIRTVSERLIGFSLEIFNSLKMVIHTFEATSHSGYICLIVSFAEYLRSRCVLDRILSEGKANQKLFEPINRWLLETDELHSQIEEMFPQGIVWNTIKEIEREYGGESSAHKIFATVLLSNPRHTRDKNFLSKAFLFAKRAEADMWYNRIVRRNFVDEVSDMKLMENELLELRMSPVPNSSLFEQSGICILKSFGLPPPALAGLHGVCLYLDIQRLQSVNQNLMSYKLRLLAEKAELVLSDMNKAFYDIL